MKSGWWICSILNAINITYVIFEIRKIILNMFHGGPGDGLDPELPAPLQHIHPVLTVHLNQGEGENYQRNKKLIKSLRIKNPRAAEKIAYFSTQSLLIFFKLN